MRAFAIAVTIVVTACSGGKGGAADGAADVGSPADAGTDAAAAACDPAVQDCAAGAKCDFGCQGNMAALSCRPENGDGGLGSACSGTAPCAKGSGCFGLPDAGIVCRRYCAADADCPTGERCHNVSVAVACGGASTALPLRFCY
jgi:hypothetical protein